MAELLPLDKAAAQVGKSEVTLRRLLKAGKIPFEKEKTLTGFVYRVDPDTVRAYYRIREGSIEDLARAAGENGESEDDARSESSRKSVRVAVAGETGGAHEYWQKKSDMYEEKYNAEVMKHAQTREELGVWRGRAEQAQAMLMKLLPAPNHVEVKPPQPSEKPAPADTDANSGVVWAWLLSGLLILLLLVAAGVIIYLRVIAR
ncbi:hypothetical protein KGQ71_02575 [Patescibacteria group bacterium]|nr:hypothetical protein [Patescibacteria group bacterium]